jgi:hypothetical protein
MHSEMAAPSNRRFRLHSSWHEIDIILQTRAVGVSIRRETVHTYAIGCSHRSWLGDWKNQKPEK